MITKNCEICREKFKTIPAKIKVGRGKFCSKKCFSISRIGYHPKSEFKKGHIPQIKGNHLSVITKKKISLIHKGKHKSIQQRIKISNSLKGKSHKQSEETKTSNHI